MEKSTPRRSIGQAESSGSNEKLVRLLRLSESLGMDEATRALLQQEVIGHRGAESVPMGSLANEAERTDVQGAKRFELERRIRKLVDEDAPWNRIEEVAWQLMRLLTSADIAGRMVELAFLHGSLSDVDHLMVRLRSFGRRYYSCIHPAIRARLCLANWQRRVGGQILTILLRERDQDYLQPVERMYVLYTLLRAKDAATPYFYFRKHQNEILEAVKQLGPEVGLTQNQFCLRIGSLALELGYSGEGRHILDTIEPGSYEHEEALRLLLNVKVERNTAGQSHYMEILFKEGTGEGRVTRFQEFVQKTRELGGFRDQNRPAFNEILKDPLSWLPDDVNVWDKVAGVLIENRDLERLLPNFLQMFYDNALTYHPAQLDTALWNRWTLRPFQKPQDLYFAGVAYLHKYVATGEETLLWRARTLVLDSRAGLSKPLPPDWRKLHKAVYQQVAKTKQLFENDRIRMLQQLRVAKDIDSIDLSEIGAYLSKVETPPPAVLTKLEEIVAAKQAFSLQGKILWKRAKVTHLTNQDADQLWRIAIGTSDHDLAWRAATILHARHGLHPGIGHAWQISGEKRSQYPFLGTEMRIAKLCMQGFSPNESRLIHSCLMVGTELPELIACLDQNVAVARKKAPPLESLEMRIDKVLSALNWLGQRRKKYTFSYQSMAHGMQVPAFANVLPNNTWSFLTAGLAERLGINAWGWQLSRLNEKIVDIIPRLTTRQDLRRYSGRIARWLRKLSPEQRSAWQEFAALARVLDDEDAKSCLAKYICRLSTVTLQNHYLALTSLQSMRADVDIIWDLEAWILSPTYSDIRRRLGTRSRVPVPNSLQRLPTIIKKSG